MAKKTTRWKPDSCKCTIDMEWDDALPQDQVTHTQAGVVEKCEEHASVSDAVLLEELFGENRYKNRVINKAAEVLGLEGREALDVIDFKFDKDRKLEIELKGSAVAKRAEIEAAIEADPTIDTSRNGRLKSITAK